MVTAMDQEKIEKLFNPQNTNEKPAENSKALLAFTRQRKIQIHISCNFRKTRFMIPNPWGADFFSPILTKYKTFTLFFFFQNIAINILLHLLHNHCKTTTKKIVLLTSKGGEEQHQNGYIFYLKHGRGCEGGYRTHDRSTFLLTC